MTIRKSIRMFVLLCSIASAVIGCSTMEDQRKSEIVIQKEGVKAYLSLEESIDKSYCVIKAKLNRITEGKTSREYDFTLEETIIGSMSDTQFFVEEGYTDYSVENTGITYSTNQTDYEAGKEYILVLSKETSVYYERDRYMILGEVFIELDEAGNIALYRRYHQIEESPYKTAEEFSKHAQAVTDVSKERLVYGIAFTRSSEVPDIVDASQYIVKAIVKDIKIETPQINRDTYLCTVTETLRGSTDKEILIVLFKDTVKVGEEYLFLINKENENSLIYTLSSVHSVVDWEKENSVYEEIFAYVNK